MLEKVTACMLGATSSGKTTLIASWVKCLNDGYHGLPPDIEIVAHNIKEDEFEAPDETRHHIFGAGGGPSTKLHESLKKSAGPPATSTDGIYPSFFRIEVGPRGADGGGRTVLLKVIDAAGEHGARTGEPAWDQRPPVQEDQRPPVQKDQRPPVQKELDNQIRQSAAIVVAVPFDDIDSHDWVDSLEDTLHRACAQPGVQRVVVAFTRYERLFMRFGASAFQFAARDAVARYVLRRTLERAEWLKRLRGFEEEGKRKVRFAVTSAFGFVRGHGNPNINPLESVELERRFLAGDHADPDLWRPFLTADPFIFAALDQNTRFTFPFQAIDRQRGPASQPSSPPWLSPPRPAPSPVSAHQNSRTDKAGSGGDKTSGESTWRRWRKYFD
jgi:hypothetical protein